MSNARKHTDPSLWHLCPTASEAAKQLVVWSDEAIAANWYKAQRAYTYGSAFEGYSLTSFSSFGLDVRSTGALDGCDVPITVNRIRSLAQTFVALTGANEDPVPQFVTNGGSYEQEQAAQNMDRVVCAEYEQQHGAYHDFHALCRKLELLVTTALGRGWIFVFPGTYGGRSKPEAEIDDGLTIGLVKEHQFGRILRLCRSTWRDPESLISRYPSRKQAILDCVELVQPSIKSGQALPGYKPSQDLQPTQRLVRVIQGWNIGTGKNNPGRELFALRDGTVLEDSKWERATPPGRYIDYEEELSADGGVPLTHTIYRLFIRENEMLHDSDELERRMPQEILKTRAGTGTGASVKKQLENARGIEVVELPGDLKELEAVKLGGLNRKTVELMGIYAGLQHEIPGISRGHTDGTQPRNVNSGVQLSLEASLFPERHADFVMRFNRFRAVDCAELFVWAIKDIVKSKELYSVWAGDEDMKRLVKGDDLDLDLSKYRIQVKPASARKDSVATRLQKAERWLEDPTVQFTGADMANFWRTYDVDRASDELDGITEGVRKQLRKWRSLPLPEAHAQYRSPSKWMTLDGLQSALRIVVSDYDDARDGKVPEDRLRLWETYMNQATALIRELKLEEAKLAAIAAGAPVEQEPAGGGGAAAGPVAQPGAPGGVN